MNGDFELLVEVTRSAHLLAEAQRALHVYLVTQFGCRTYVIEGPVPIYPCGRCDECKKRREMEVAIHEAATRLRLALVAYASAGFEPKI